MPSFRQSPPYGCSSPKIRVVRTPTPVEDLPLPYVRAPPSPPYANKRLKPYPAPVLPSRPEPVRWHYRNELQRRVSPPRSTTRNTSLSDGPLSIQKAALTIDEIRKERCFQIPPRTKALEESFYVLTLKTSSRLEEEMQKMRNKWFPAGRNKVPAHITLFHALPGSKLTEVSNRVDTLARSMPCFNIAAGRVSRRRRGVAINVGDGDKEIRRIFFRLRNIMFEWLSEQDQSMKAHWTIMNKEDDSEKVDAAFEEIEKCELIDGLATGLVLWRYEKNGTWSFNSEFAFQSNGAVQETGLGSKADGFEP